MLRGLLAFILSAFDLESQELVVPNIQVVIVIFEVEKTCVHAMLARVFFFMKRRGKMSHWTRFVSVRVLYCYCYVTFLELRLSPPSKVTKTRQKK